MNYDHSLYYDDVYRAPYVWFEVSGELPTEDADIGYGYTDEHNMGKILVIGKQRGAVETGSETLTVTVQISGGYGSSAPIQTATITITGAKQGYSFTREEGLNPDD